jgi:predicted RNase H-like HicB family nuclease
VRHDSLTVSSNFQAFDQPVTFTWNVLLDPGPIRPSTSLSSQVRSTFYCRRADHASGRAKSQGYGRGAGNALPGAPGGCAGAQVQAAAGGRAVTAYPIQVYWSDEDRAWVADVPDLPFCTAHEPAPHEAVAEVEQAVAAWLEGAKAPGAPGAGAIAAGCSRLNPRWPLPDPSPALR